jgi:CRISPR-associated protein Csd2
MGLRGLYIFSHDSKLGNAPAHQLFAKVKAELKDKDVVPRKFNDYKVSIDGSSLPSGVHLEELVTE